MPDKRNIKITIDNLFSTLFLLSVICSFGIVVGASSAIYLANLLGSLFLGWW